MNEDNCIVCEHAESDHRDLNADAENISYDEPNVVCVRCLLEDTQPVQAADPRWHDYLSRKEYNARK